jgi:hypothetical protein
MPPLSFFENFQRRNVTRTEKGETKFGLPLFHGRLKKTKELAAGKSHRSVM